MQRPILAALAVLAISLASFVPTTWAQESPEEPKVQEGWPDQGTLQVQGETVSASNPSAERTIEGPFGSFTVKATFIPSKEQGRQAFASGTCWVQYSSGEPSYWFDIWTPWSWDYSSITNQGSTYYDEFAAPLFNWSGQQTRDTWQPGWQYGWGNGRANLNWSYPPVGFTVGEVRLEALVDAWGNCTPHAEFIWF